MTLHRFAIVAAALTFLLVGVGGVVTSRDAGMVFNDWPLSDGGINPDGWVFNPDQRAEHGHRLLGSLVGLATMILAIWVQRWDSRRSMRILGWVAFAFVCFQGLLGGLRVTESDGTLALVHGCTGQAFFAMMVALAYLTSRDGREEPESGGDVRMFLYCSLAVMFAVYLQVVLGAQLRHHGGTVSTHLLGAALVAVAVVWLLTIALLRHPDRPALRRPVLVLAGLLLVQVGLGIYAAQILARTYHQDYTLARVVLPTAHQSVGALMLATTVVISLAAWRRRDSARLVEVFA